MKIFDATPAEVRDFLKCAGASLKTFRYFEKRGVGDAVERHVATLVGYLDDGALVAYGHLDEDERACWLGVCVAEGRVGTGLGTLMMRELLACADRHGFAAVWLVVDAENLRARCLYEKFGFKIAPFFDANVEKRQRREVVFMRRARSALEEKAVAETLGTIIDKLFTVDTKMWNGQELLYEIRKMTFEEYKAKYFTCEDGARQLWETLKKACDLNVQRNQLIGEVDAKVIEIVKAAVAGAELDNGSFIQRQHKTY